MLRRDSKKSGASNHVTASTILVATWNDGLFVFSGGSRNQELANRSVRTLAPDGRGGALAIVDNHSLRRRAPDGAWNTIVTAKSDLSCCVKVGDVIYVGTDDAHVLRVSAAGEIEQLRGFDVVAGRDKWYAGSAVINGKRVGPPLGIRSITATSDGAVLLANVHVGGIPRSADGGVTWQPTIDIDSDVHEVRAHPSRPRIVAAAAAVGLCTSADGGATWQVDQSGLHATHCSAVAFAGDDVLVSAAEDPFAPESAIYRWEPRGIRGPRMNILPWLRSPAACPHGSTGLPTVVASPLMARQSPSPTWEATSTYLPTPVTLGRVVLTVFQLQAAS